MKRGNCWWPFTWRWPKCRWDCRRRSKLSSPEFGELLNEVEKHLRRYSHELRPTILDDLGWIPAVRFLADGISKRANLPIHIEAIVTGRLPTAAETTLIASSRRR